MGSRTANQNSTPLRSLLNEAIPFLRTEWKWTLKQRSLTSLEQVERMGRAYADYLVLVRCFNEHRLSETAGARLRRRLAPLMDLGAKVAQLIAVYEKQIEKRRTDDDMTEAMLSDTQKVAEALLGSEPHTELVEVRRLAETEGKWWWLKGFAQGLAGGS